MQEPKQMLIEEVYFAQLRITREDWNLARNLFRMPYYHGDGEDIKLERVMEDPNLLESVLNEIRVARHLYTTGIVDAQVKCDIETERKLREEYMALQSEQGLK